MKYAAVDIGNSSVKVALFDQLDLLGRADPGHLERLGFQTPPTLPNEAADYHWFICSVNRQACEHFTRWLRDHRPADLVHCLSWKDFPLEVNVRYPDRVGLDRLATATGAKQRRKTDQPVVVVDCGTAITVDCLSSIGSFEGGAILPGLEMGMEGLARNTDALPKLDWSRMVESPEVVGRETDAAIQSGLYWGQLGAVRELVDRMAGPFDGDFQVLVTGGTGHFIVNEIRDDRWQWAPHLIFEGMGVAARGVIETA